MFENGISMERLVFNGHSSFYKSNIIIIIRKIFILKIGKIRQKLGNRGARALSLCDGHSTRQDSVIQTDLRLNNVDFLVLPPNTTNFLQPLDQSVNAAFKMHLKDSLSSLNPEDDSGSLTAKTRRFIATNLPSIISSTLTVSTITDGWRRSKLDGIFSESRLMELSIVQRASSMANQHEIQQKNGSIGGTVAN